MSSTLLILFEAGGERYGLDASAVVEIVPMVRLRRVPAAPAHVAGTINYRGSMVPVIDMSSLLAGRCAEERMSTRIILANCARVHRDRRLLGLLAEHATDACRYDPARLMAPAVAPRRSPHLGKILADAQGTIQLVMTDDLPPDEIDRALLAPEEPPPCPTQPA